MHDGPTEDCPRGSLECDVNVIGYLGISNCDALHAKLVSISIPRTVAALRQSCQLALQESSTCQRQLATS